MELTPEMKAAQERQPGPGKRNIYMCQKCGHGFTSVDVDEGTTPFSTTCLQPKCGGLATSFMYAVPQVFLSQFPCAVEWYKPRFADMKKMDGSTQRHVRAGGLIPRLANEQ